MPICNSLRKPIRFKKNVGLSVEEIATIFETWNQGELKSYLIEITAEILRKKMR